MREKQVQISYLMDIGMHIGLVTRTVHYHGDVCTRSALTPLTTTSDGTVVRRGGLHPFLGWDCGEER